MRRRDMKDVIITPPGDFPLDVPAFDGRGGNAQLGGHRADTAELLENAGDEATCGLVHKSHHNRTFDVRQSHYLSASEFRTLPHMNNTPDAILKALDRLKIPHEEIAAALGRDRTVATKMLAKKRSIKAQEMPVLLSLIERYERERGEVGEASTRDYLPVSILPTFAGAGGGGTGEGEVEYALIPRSLIEGELRGDPDDFVLITLKGDSMEPDFHHGDQLLCDKRDRSPAQPGPFAIWDGEWGEYVVKNVERIEGGRWRMFSSNPKYSATEIQHDETRIIGRPVWFGRRL